MAERREAPAAGAAGAGGAPGEAEVGRGVVVVAAGKNYSVKGGEIRGIVKEGEGELERGYGVTHSGENIFTYAGPFLIPPPSILLPPSCSFRGPSFRVRGQLSWYLLVLGAKGP